MSKTERLKQIKAELKPLGVTVTKRPKGELRVNLAEGTEATAYYTTDLDDANQTGRAMAAREGMKTLTVGEVVITPNYGVMFAQFIKEAELKAESAHRDLTPAAADTAEAWQAQRVAILRVIQGIVAPITIAAQCATSSADVLTLRDTLAAMLKTIDDKASSLEAAMLDADDDAHELCTLASHYGEDQQRRVTVDGSVHITRHGIGGVTITHQRAADMDLATFRARYPFRPYQLVSLDGQIVEVISYPWASEDGGAEINVRLAPGDPTTLATVDPDALIADVEGAR